MFIGMGIHARGEISLEDDVAQEVNTGGSDPRFVRSASTSWGAAGSKGRYRIDG